MEYEQIKEWLDNLVSNFLEAKALKNFNTQIFTCGCNRGIQIYQGIEILADVMGLSLTEQKRDYEDYPYEYSFIYGGVMFNELSEERLGVYAGAD